MGKVSTAAAILERLRGDPKAHEAKLFRLYTSRIAAGMTRERALEEARIDANYYLAQTKSFDLVDRTETDEPETDGGG